MTDPTKEDQLNTPNGRPCAGRRSQTVLASLERFLSERHSAQDLNTLRQALQDGSLAIAELLGSQKMAAFLDAFKEAYDYIVIDSPPLMAVTDAAVLSRSVDGVLLVVKPGMTKLGALSGAMESLKRVQAHILGLALNEIPTRGSRYYYQGYQYHKYDEYQSEESSD